jgi:hypothetical protein
MWRRGRQRVPDTHFGGVGSDGVDGSVRGARPLWGRCCHTAAHDESRGDREHLE